MPIVTAANRMLGNVTSMPREERLVSSLERDAEILRLHGRGWTMKQIAKQVGMSANGVHQVILRSRRPSVE